MATKKGLIESLKVLLENQDVEAIQEEVGNLKAHYEQLLQKDAESAEKPNASGSKDEEAQSEASHNEEPPVDAPTAPESVATPDPSPAVSEVTEEKTTTVNVPTEETPEAEESASPTTATTDEATIPKVVDEKDVAEAKDTTDNAEAAVEKPAEAEAKSDDTQESDTEEAPVTAIESIELKDEHDKAFKLLLDEFNTRRNDLRKKRAEEIKKNLEAAKAVISDLKLLNAEEENISRSFNKLKELQAAWKAIGNVPKDQYRELQHDYSQELDIFFYNINIYKELRENDLKRNSGLKQALISDVEALKGEKNIKTLDQKLREYQEQWHQIGPTPKEEWEQMRDSFWAAIREAYSRIHEHFEKRREEHATNLAAKQALLDKVKVITEKENKGHKDWKSSTDEVIAVQAEWKTVGFATKKDNERIWKEFRAVCDAFFQKKNAFYGELKSTNAEGKAAKEKLIAEALALKDNTDWRDTTEKFKRLQRDWKDSGHASPREDQVLWKKFRSACDHFFNTKKQHFASQDEAQAANLKLKEALLKKISGHKNSGEKQKELAAIKAYQEEWKAVGHVPMKKKEDLNNAYFKAIDGLFNALDMGEQEKAKARFQSKLDSMSGTQDAGRSIQKEQNFIRGKKQKLQEELRQLEGNKEMFFKHAKDDNPLVKEVNKNMERIQREIDKLSEQEKLLRQHAKQAE